jgi:beta-barrel assembly-enhancing protease
MTSLLRTFFLLLLPLFVLGGISGCAVNPATGRTELALIPVATSEEIAIGERTFPQAVQQMGGEYPDARLAAYVNQVGLRLGRASQRPDLPYQFKVVNNSTPNAFALPGGFIAITRGLLVNMDNEAQLAAILGHEIGHVTARHAVQGIQRGTLFNVALSVISGVTGDTAFGPLAQQAGELSAALLDRSYSREQERESDRLGIDYMVQAAYDPQGAVQVQEFFYRQIEGGAKPMWVSGLFRSHPFSKERMQANDEYIRTRYAQTLNNPNYVLRPDTLQTAIAPLQKSRKGYELYDEARQLETAGNLSRAIAVYLQAAAAAPDESLILTGLGMAYLKAEDASSARLHLARAVQLDGKYYLSRMGFGYALLQKGDNPSAVRELEASMKLLPTLQGGYLLAEGYEKTGQPQKALELYRAVAQADPKGKLGLAAAERVQALQGR